ncbi:MAG: nitroreductase family protein [Candidatus Binatia bacterium]
MAKPVGNEEGLFDIMYSCRSMRRLKPDPVPEELLLQLIDAAVQAPSGMDSQNWRFVIVRDSGQKARIAEIWRKGWAFYDGIAADAEEGSDEELAKRARLRKASAYLIDHLEEVPAFIFVCTRSDPKFDKIMNAPSTVLALLKHVGVAAVVRLGMSKAATAAQVNGAGAYPAVQNLLLAARALGLGAVLTTPHLFTPGELEAVVGLPAETTLHAVVPVGYPKGRFGALTRPDPRDLVSWDRVERD